IRDGVMVGRLHNAATAVDFNENLTGNARATSFEYEPIVRMTNTYIESGKKPLCLLIGEVDNGFLIETIKSGFGSTNFTISPAIAYRIRKGTIAEPVKISLLTGNAFETLFKIDGISDEVSLNENPFVSCTKRDQSMLPIDFGGPYVRISEIDVVG
ncbi:MAG TPA: metallopeptidase TldD-related protein, partial [Thermotogota bacterium]|nr:metallopeptidase TldD-related protein [Thermotogota bacterium]